MTGFLVEKRRKDPNTTISGPFLADDGPTLNAYLVALCFSGDPDQYCKEILYLCDFSEGVGVQTVLVVHMNFHTDHQIKTQHMHLTCVDPGGDRESGPPGKSQVAIGILRNTGTAPLVRMRKLGVALCEIC